MEILRKQRISVFIPVLLCCYFLFFLPPFASGQSAPCGPKCNCGCAAGGACTCKQKQSMPCGPNCKCGCVAGGACTCQNNQEGCDLQNYQQDTEYLQYQEEDFYPEYQERVGECLYPGQAECEIKSCPENSNRTVHPSQIDANLWVNECWCEGGIWLPEDPPLFRPFMADPRQVTYSVGWRFDDNAFTRNIVDVSYADTCALYRWCNVWPWHGDLQIEVEGALWAIFAPCHESAPLINADYYVGIPITYAIDCWQFRLRGYHISSHIGDEYLLNHPDFDRKNPSAEYIDFFISHDLTDEIRIYGGIGYVVSQDKSFKIPRFFSAIGGELRLLRLGFLDCKNVLYGCPIFGMYFRQNSDFKKHVDATYVLGYEIGKLCGLYRRLRMYMEYHDGYSLEGQFANIPTNYFSLRVSYGF